MPQAPEPCPIRNRRRAAIPIRVALLPGLGAAPSSAGTPDMAPGQVCNGAAAQAAWQSGVPRAVPMAILRTETGRRRDGAVQPRPWTVNMGGTGMWFDNRADALAHVDEARGRRARSVDAGRFQINHHLDPKHSASVDQMFDPPTNARHAARFPSGPFVESGNRDRAAGAVHARTKEQASLDVAICRRHRNALRPAPAPSPPMARSAEPRVNAAPRLRARGAGQGRLGLLIDAGAGTARSLFGGA